MHIEHAAQLAATTTTNNHRPKLLAIFLDNDVVESSSKFFVSRYRQIIRVGGRPLEEFGFREKKIHMHADSHPALERPSERIFELRTMALSTGLSTCPPGDSTHLGFYWDAKVIRLDKSDLGE